MGNNAQIKGPVPVKVEVPDGNYYGIMGGWVVRILHNKKPYQFKYSVGVRGMNIKVLVKVVNGMATVTFN